MLTLASVWVLTAAIVHFVSHLEMAVEGSPNAVWAVLDYFLWAGPHMAQQFAN